MDLFSDTLFALSVFVGFAFIVGFFALMYLLLITEGGNADRVFALVLGAI